MTELSSGTCYAPLIHERVVPDFEDVKFNFVHYKQMITLEQMLKHNEQRRLSDTSRKAGKKLAPKVQPEADKNES